MVQIAQFIIDGWSKPFKDNHANCDIFTSMESFGGGLRRPTVKRSLIHADSYLNRYIRGFDDVKLTKFLCYCTGSTMVCVEAMKVSFTDLDGAARRPIAHTC